MGVGLLTEEEEVERRSVYSLFESRAKTGGEKRLEKWMILLERNRNCYLEFLSI